MRKDCSYEASADSTDRAAADVVVLSVSLVPIFIFTPIVMKEQHKVATKKGFPGKSERDIFITLSFMLTYSCFPR